MNVALELHDSIVESVDARDGNVIVRLSSAYLHHSVGRPGIDSGSGYVQPAILAFSGATCTGLSPECRGLLYDGVFRVGSEDFPLLPIPAVSVGPVRANISFESGASLRIQAEHMTCEMIGTPTFVDRFGT